MKYFAYGSNMLERRLKHGSRVPSAEFISIGEVRDRVLRFHKLGKDGSAKCDAPVEAGGVVYGVLFDVPKVSLDRLDAVEDVPRGGYHRTTLQVRIGDGAVVAAFTYNATPEFVREGLLPFDWYKALIVAGAIEHGLPQRYVDDVRGRPARPDPVASRTAAAMESLGEFQEEFLSGRLTGRCS